MAEPWRKGDAVEITCEGRTVIGTVRLASDNNVSLVLAFEGILAKHVAMMPVLLDDDGVYRSIVNEVAVTLRRPGTPTVGE